MKRTIELRLARAEGAIVRTLGLIERRGFTVTAIATRSDAGLKRSCCGSRSRPKAGRSTSWCARSCD